MTGLGVVAALAAAVANAFAVVLQAAEARRSPASEAARAALLVRLAHRRRWLAGIGLMVLAWPLQIVALALAPITVVQPALATTTLVLLAIAQLRLGERIGAREVLGALAIAAGITAVVLAAPRHIARDAPATRLLTALLVVGIAAVAAYALGRIHARTQLTLVVGAGLAYAWVDFVNKLLADDLATAHWALAALWLAATLGLGALAFLEETTALQRRPAVTVAPIIGAVQDPLPVLMALWAGVEVWSAGPGGIVELICGLVAVTAGAALLGRSRAVARIAGDEVCAGNRRRPGDAHQARSVVGNSC